MTKAKVKGKAEREERRRVGVVARTKAKRLFEGFAEHAERLENVESKRSEVSKLGKCRCSGSSVSHNTSYDKHGCHFTAKRRPNWNESCHFLKERWNC